MTDLDHDERFFIIRIRWYRDDNGDYIDHVRYLCGVRESATMEPSLDLSKVRRFKTASQADQCRNLKVVTTSATHLFSWDPNSNGWSIRTFEGIFVKPRIEVVEIVRQVRTTMNVVRTDAQVLDRMAEV